MNLKKPNSIKNLFKTIGKVEIYLDFDGTIVEHQYPLIGRCNLGCLEIIDKLNKAGHEIVLNTMRVEFDKKLLMEAIEFINHSMTDSTQNYSIKNTDHKYEPTKWDWNLHFNTGRIFIDDACEGIPLKKGIVSSRGMVDWDIINLEFEEHGLYL